MNENKLESIISESINESFKKDFWNNLLPKIDEYIKVLLTDNENTIMKEQISFFRDLNSKSENKIKELENSLLLLEEKKNGLENTNSLLESDNKKLGDVLSEKRARISELGNEIKTLNSEKNESENKITELESKNGALKNKVSEFENKNNVLESEKTDLEKTLSEKETKISELGNDIKDLNFEKTKFENKIKEFEFENGALKNRVSEFENDKQEQIKFLTSKLNEIVAFKYASKLMNLGLKVPNFENKEDIEPKTVDDYFKILQKLNLVELKNALKDYIISINVEDAQKIKEVLEPELSLIIPKIRENYNRELHDVKFIRKDGFEYGEIYKVNQLGLKEGNNVIFKAEVEVSQ